MQETTKEEEKEGEEKKDLIFSIIGRVQGCVSGIGNGTVPTMPEVYNNFVIMILFLCMTVLIEAGLLRFVIFRKKWDDRKHGWHIFLAVVGVNIVTFAIGCLIYLALFGW